MNIYAHLTGMQRFGFSSFKRFKMSLLSCDVSEYVHFFSLAVSHHVLNCF